MKTLVIPQKIKFIGIFSIMLAFFAACTEEPINDLAQEEADLQTIETIVEKTTQLYLSSEVTGGDENTALTVENDGLIDEYVTAPEDLEPQHPIRSNRFMGCLKPTNLTDEQKPLVRRAVMAFQMRNKAIIMQQRLAVAELHNAKEQSRQLYISQLRSGEITRIEFENKMAELRQRFVEALLNIKKPRAAEFAPSFRMLLKNLNEILDSSQWQQFADCLKAAKN